MPKVNPEILRWARETAGLTPEGAVKKLGLKPTKNVPALSRLEALESGEDTPSRPMLVKMSQQYRRPLVTFYLSATPRRGDRGQDFRALGPGESLADHPLLDALIRDIRARQSMVRAVLEDEEEAEVLAFVGSQDMSAGVPAVLSSIRNTLGVSLEDFRSQGSSMQAFALLRRAAEQAGVFVLLKGDLGSRHTAIDAETFRGFALADDVAPFVVINHQDSKAAWSFTLLHELAHIWLGQTGVSGGYGELKIEKFCNDVASEYLLPSIDVAQLLIGDANDMREVVRRIGEFADDRNLSNSMVAYRLYRAGVIGKAIYRDVTAVFHTHWEQSRLKQREKNRGRDGGPSFYTVRGHRLGQALLALVRRMVSGGALTPSKAGKVLGVKAQQVQVLLETGERGGAHRPA